MKYEMGTVTVRLMVDVFEDEDGEVTIDGGSVPTLSVEVDLPGDDPVALAAKYLRRAAEDIEPKKAA